MAFWKKSNSDTPAQTSAPHPSAPQPSAPSAAAPAAKPQVSLIEPKAATAPPPSAAPAGGAAPQLSKEEMQRRAQVSKRLEQAFGEIASVFMRAAPYRQFTLADMEWLVVPAVLSGQFSIAEAQSKTSGFTTPVALVTWAKVSAAVDQRLSAEPDKPTRLKPEEWKSGDIIWVIDAVGEPKVLSALIKRLRSIDWAGKPVKIRTKGDDGKAKVVTMEPVARSAA